MTRRPDLSTDPNSDAVELVLVVMKVGWMSKLILGPGGGLAQLGLQIHGRLGIAISDIPVHNRHRPQHELIIHPQTCGCSETAIAT